jgi:hypothetical protein
MELEQITSEGILPGKIVIYIQESCSIQVGRVIEGSIKHYNLIEALTSGVIAEFDMLEPEKTQRVVQQVYTTFFASQHTTADWPPPGVYGWPDDLMPLTFDEQRTGGWIKHVQMKFRRVAPLLILEE